MGKKKGADIWLSERLSLKITVPRRYKMPRGLLFLVI